MRVPRHHRWRKSLIEDRSASRYHARRTGDEDGELEKVIRDLRGANVVVKDLARFDRTGGHRKRDRARDLDGRCGLMMLDLYECIVHGVRTARLGDGKLGMTRRAAWTPVPGERAKQDGDPKCHTVPSQLRG